MLRHLKYLLTFLACHRCAHSSGMSQDCSLLWHVTCVFAALVCCNVLTVLACHVIWCVTRVLYALACPIYA